ncbi:MAG: RNA polymerase sigma factor [Herpetosiphonaceae bacterium]|nr:RNA polymerase sigma factor [Herpetosiphonaceae bacterium]
MDVTPALEAHDRQHIVAQWFVAYRIPLARYLLRLLNDEELAADLLQDTFLRAFNALSGYPATKALPEHPFAWLHRIATNLAFNALQRQHRFRWLPLNLYLRLPAFENSVGTAQNVRRCLAHLKAKDAEALLLYEYVGLTCAEIAAQTGEATPAVRMRISRARKRFQAFYKKEDDI